MHPPYLTGDLVALREMRMGDARASSAWQPGPAPLNAPAAEECLKEKHGAAWRPNDPLLLAVVRIADDAVVGAVEIEHPQGRIAGLAIRTSPALASPEADRIAAAALRLVVAWLRDEAEAMVVTAPIPADCPFTLAAAEELGMVQGTRLRQFVARPGGRVDLFEYQALNPMRVP